MILNIFLSVLTVWVALLILVQTIIVGSFIYFVVTGKSYNWEPEVSTHE
jgi:uncharacterized protein YxeA